MIRINLLPQKRTRRRDKGKETVLAGLLFVLLAGAVLVFLVHMPLQEEVDRLQSATGSLARENQEKESQLKGYKELKEAVAAAEERKAVIERLNAARATPAHLMRELGAILTTGRTPSMTREMSKEIKENPNRELSLEWDPKHVWLTKFEETDGAFRMEGGAQSDGDMTQLALRLQASVYFHDVVPREGKEFTDRNSGASYYQFTIVGRVAY